MGYYFSITFHRQVSDQSGFYWADQPGNYVNRCLRDDVTILHLTEIGICRHSIIIIIVVVVVVVVFINISNGHK